MFMVIPVFNYEKTALSILVWQFGAKKYLFSSLINQWGIQTVLLLVWKTI